jgi:hypothetical protein
MGAFSNAVSVSERLESLCCGAVEAIFVILPLKHSSPKLIVLLPDEEVLTVFSRVQSANRGRISPPLSLLLLNYDCQPPIPPHKKPIHQTYTKST